MALQKDEQKMVVPSFRKHALVLIPYFNGRKTTQD